MVDAGPTLVEHAVAPSVRRRARLLAALAPLVAVVGLVAAPGAWLGVMAVAVVVGATALLAALTSRLVVEVDAEAIRWTERSVVPGFARTVRLRREGIDQLYVGELPPSLVDRATPVPASLRVAFPDETPGPPGVARRYQLWAIARGEAASIVDHPELGLLQAIERTAERRWGIVDRRVPGEVHLR